MFSINEGLIDRLLRIIVGIGLIALVFVGPMTPFGWIGVVPLFTGIVGWCPIYTVLGIKTCKTKT
ncbi:MAG: YgaP family membrane protein [Hyphomonas sp.]